MKALIIVDMVNDFVAGPALDEERGIEERIAEARREASGGEGREGSGGEGSGGEGLANEALARQIVPAIRRLLDHARADEEWVTVYANTAHRSDDREIDIWGRHALAGTFGAQVIEALAPIGADREIVLAKRHYGAFDKTELDDILFDYDVADVILVGQHTHRGISHTAYGAFLSGYDIHVPMDAVCSLPSTDNQAALGALREMYGVNLTTSIALIGRPVLRTASYNPGKSPGGR